MILVNDDSLMVDSILKVPTQSLETVSAQISNMSTTTNAEILESALKTEKTGSSVDTKSRKMYQCKICLKKYTWQKNLITHIQ